MAGISVGSVSVDIVPDTTNFRRELNAKLRDLSVPVRLDLNDKAFRTELDAATRNRDVNVHVDDNGSINRMQGRTHNLIAALALLAPAAAPLTAVAIGGAAALTGLGATGILAVKGIQAEMKAGTATGLAYTTQIGTLKTGVAALERTAASGVLTGFTTATGELTKQMPFLNREVGFLSRSLGSDLAPVTAGILGLFEDLSPTTHSIANGIHGLAVDFESWATGPGGRAFADYLARELPVVVQTLESLGTAGAHVVQALLPLGGPVLGAIKGVSDVIGHLPVGVVQAMFLAFAGYRTILLTAAAIDAVTAATKRLQITQATGGGTGGVGGKVGRGAGAAGFLGGPAGLVIGATVGLFGELAVAKGDNQDRAQAAISALRDPANMRAAQQRLQALQARQSQLQAQGAPGQKGFLGNNTNALQGAQQQSLATVGSQIAALKAQIGAAKGASDSLNTSLAAGGQSFTAWASKASAAFTTAAGLKSATIGLHQAVADATASLHDNGRTLDLNTQKGRDNRTALLNLATAEHTKIDADIAAGKPQKDITRDIVDGHHQLEIMARKFGLSKDAAKRYADSLLAVPRNVLTTVTVNGIAKSAAQIAALKRSMGALDFYAGQKGGATGGLFSGGQFLRRDSGGPVWGAGSSTSDSIPALLSNGEFVIKAATVKAVGAPYLHKLNDTGVAAGAGMPDIYVKLTEAGEWMLAKADVQTRAQLYASARGISAGRR